MNEKVSRGNGTLEESTIWVDMITDSMGAVSMFSIKLISTLFVFFYLQKWFWQYFEPQLIKILLRGNFVCDYRKSFLFGTVSRREISFFTMQQPTHRRQH